MTREDASFLFVHVMVILSTLTLAPVVAASEAVQSLSLSEDEHNYIIENDYYKAVIPKPSAPAARGIVRWLYIRNAVGEWSSNLVMEDTFSYGLGYLEGSGAATENRCWGMQNQRDMTLAVLEDTGAKIVVEANAALWGTDFTETWTFWAKKPYFRSEAVAVVTDENGFLTNELQFCWMINHNLRAEWYGTDRNGNIVEYGESEIQQIHSPDIDTFPWINWQFVDENVSLGLVFVDIYDHKGTVGETGDWDFEYQLDFELGSALFGNPVKKGYRREVTTIYYTSNQATNKNVSNFAQNHYMHSSTITEQNPILQAAQYVDNPHGQNEGLGSAFVSSPYFLVRQNAQNRGYRRCRPQYETSIYAPLYKYQQTIHPESWDFQEQLVYSLGYNDGSNTFEYGFINDVLAYNSDDETSLRMDATSRGGQVAYSSTFATWSDSDKLKIEGSALNAEFPVLTKEIYVSLRSASGLSTYFEAETAEPFDYISESSSSTDSLWTEYNYGCDSRTTLFYFDSEETVPALAVPLSIPSGDYKVIAYVQERPEGDITYRYSLDSETWNSFVVPQAESIATHAAELGRHTVTNSTFYIDDDDDASSGIAGWAGWDRIALIPLPSRISPNIYEFRMYDPIYGELGIAIRINAPTEDISLIDNSEIRVYLHRTGTEQTLEYFEYPFDIEIYPHRGWLRDASEFTDLHSQDAVVYTKHRFYVPEGLHRGRINTVYSDGTVSYSTEPYDNSSEINMSVIPSSDAVNVKISTWRTSGTYYKKWTEFSAGALSVSHIVGDLLPNTRYAVEVDRNVFGEYLSDDAGEISFIYTGENAFHVFEVRPELPAD